MTYVHQLDITFTDEQLRMLAFAFNQSSGGPIVLNSQTEVGNIGVSFAIECLTTIVTTPDFDPYGVCVASECLDALKAGYQNFKEIQQ